MPKYVVEYAFKHKDSTLRPKDQMWGMSRREIQTDKEPETQDEFNEISKSIFQTVPDCEIVKILKVMEYTGEDPTAIESNNNQLPGDIRPFKEGENFIG